MKLKDVPLTMQAFREIQLDQLVSGQEMNGEADVPEHWTIPLSLCEGMLAACGGLMADDVPGLSVTREQERAGITDDVTLRYALAMPADNDADIIRKYLGYSVYEGWIFQHTMEQFFEGELRKVFEVLTPGSPADRLRSHLLRPYLKRS